jgi:hypothetical protein
MIWIANISFIFKERGKRSEERGKRSEERRKKGARREESGKERKRIHILFLSKFGEVECFPLAPFFPLSSLLAPLFLSPLFLSPRSSK